MSTFNERARAMMSPQSAPNGNVVLPGTEGYEEARLAFNLAADQHPAAVAYAVSADDVVAAVTFADREGLRIAAQGTGHGAMPLGKLDDTILLKTEEMRGVSIDPEARTARAEAGAVWEDVVERAAPHGLAALAGSSPNVGVVGYTLGGGMSFLGRKYGPAAANVDAIEMVTADGRLIRADRANEPDLFWALRGGGGSFGVVTAMEFALFPVTEAYAGILWYPIERGPEVLNAWQELVAAGPPDEMTTVGRYLQFPPIPDMPEEVRGKSFVVIEVYHLGDPARADDLLAPLRALGPVNDTIQTVPVPALLRIHMDPEPPVPFVGDGLLLTGLPPAAVDAFHTAAGPGAPFPLLSVEIRHLGGAFARQDPEDCALGSTEQPFALYGVGMTPTPEMQTAAAAQVRALRDELGPWTADTTPLNFAETRRGPGAFWDGNAYQRLRRVKASVDPDDMIRSNHPVPPAR
jgi:hypothetical protein